MRITRKCRRSGTKNVVYELVRENQQREVAKETIDEKKDEIYSAAATSAKDRVKVAFITEKLQRKKASRFPAKSQSANHHDGAILQHGARPIGQKIKRKRRNLEIKSRSCLQGVGPHGAASGGRECSPPSQKLGSTISTTTTRYHRTFTCLFHGRKEPYGASLMALTKGHFFALIQRRRHSDRRP